MKKVLFVLFALVVAVSMTGLAYAQAGSTAKAKAPAHHAVAPQSGQEPMKDTSSTPSESGKATKHSKRKKKAEAKTENQETKEVKPETKPKKSEKKPS